MLKRSLSSIVKDEIIFTSTIYFWTHLYLQPRQMFAKMSRRAAPVLGIGVIAISKRTFFVENIDQLCLQLLRCRCKTKCSQQRCKAPGKELVKIGEEGVTIRVGEKKTPGCSLGCSWSSPRRRRTVWRGSKCWAGCPSHHHRNALQPLGFRISYAKASDSHHFPYLPKLCNTNTHKSKMTASLLVL